MVATPALIYKSVGTATAKTTLVDADALSLMDSADSNINKKITWANAKTQMATDGVGASFTVVSLTAGENITIGDNLCFGNTSASETQVETVTGTSYNRGKTIAYANIARKITMSSV